MKRVRKLEEHIIDIFNKVELNPMEYSIRQASQDILSLIRQAAEEAKPKVEVTTHDDWMIGMRDGISDYHNALIKKLQ